MKKKLAERELGRSVIQINPSFKTELLKKNEDVLYFGIKDTDQIPASIVKRLRTDSRYVWFTIDKMANKGRAIDTDLINPLTFRVMTGSTSGGPINILKGINDFAVGTDGGGSTLAPAMSCQLPSVIGAGIGLAVGDKSISTDNIEFKNSIGVIGKNVTMLKDVIECITGQSLSYDKTELIKIAVPMKGTIKCPDNMDMYEKIFSYLELLDCRNYTFIEIDMSHSEDRKKAAHIIQNAFNQENVDLILTCEGPVDLYGYGETIQGQFGEVGFNLTSNHGKYLMRSANMCHTTAITVPIASLASGMLILADKGIENSRKAFNFAEKLEKQVNLPVAWNRYYLSDTHQLNGYNFKENDNI